MATSTIKLYYTEFKMKDNALIDDLDIYLSGISGVLTFNNFQYVKHNTEINIKIAVEQAIVNKFRWNYVSIINSDQDKPFYYYILDIDNNAIGTVNLRLGLDTINTFSDLIKNNISAETLVIREHRDRYVKPTTVGTGNISVKRLVDRVDEGITNVPLAKTSNGVVREGDKWYLVYKNHTADTTSAIDCLILPETPLPFAVGTPDKAVFNTSFFELNKTYFFWSGDNPTFPDFKVVSGESSTMSSTFTGQLKDKVIAVKKIQDTAGKTHTYWNLGTIKSDNTIKWKFSRWDNVAHQYSVDLLLKTLTLSSLTKYRYTNQTLTNLPGTVVFQIYPSVNYDSDNLIYCNTISDIDRTDSKLIKIIELPYAPFDLVLDDNIYQIPDGWSFENKILQLTDLSRTFGSHISAENLADMTMTFPARNSRRLLDKNAYFESKLLNSSFFKYKFVYDSFSHEIRCEDLIGDSDISEGIQVNVDYNPSNSMNSNFLFKFTPSCDYYKYEDFDNIMITQRNNESPIYNSPYLDYMRNGYRFDVKNKEQLAIQTGITTGIGLLTTGITAMSAVGTGGLTAVAAAGYAGSTINSLVSGIGNVLSNERNIQQKINETKNQSASIRTSDDLNLFNLYNEGNKLRVMQYKPSDDLRNSLFELFHQTGYATNMNKIPNLNSRYYFNFIQANLVLTNENNPYLIDYIDDIKNRFNVGITVFHNRSGWDFTKSKANLETWLCE